MNLRNPGELIEFITGCCEKLPNGKLRITPAGEIRMKEVFGEHGVQLFIADDSKEIREFKVTFSSADEPQSYQ